MILCLLLLAFVQQTHYSCKYSLKEFLSNIKEVEMGTPSLKTNIVLI